MPVCKPCGSTRFHTGGAPSGYVCSHCGTGLPPDEAVAAVAEGAEFCARILPEQMADQKNFSELRRLAEEASQREPLEKDDISFIGCSTSWTKIIWGFLSEATPENVLSLLDAADRLAAIEAVTGEEVREAIDELHIYRQQMVAGGCINWASVVRRAATALLSLSAKVAEQAAEIERLMADNRDLVQHCAGRLEAARMQMARAEAAEARVKELEAALADSTRSHVVTSDHAGRIATERDTLRRLLTETAVPALEEITAPTDGTATVLDLWFAYRHRATAALSTIRALVAPLIARQEPTL